jgi:hypothetical protein
MNRRNFLQTLVVGTAVLPVALRGITFSHRPDRNTTRELCKMAPAYFIEKYVKIRDRQGNLVPLHLTEYENSVINQFNGGGRIIIHKERQVGLTTIAAAYSLWLITFHDDKNVLFVSHNFTSSWSVAELIRKMYCNLPEWLQVPLKTNNKFELKNERNSYIQMVSSMSCRGQCCTQDMVIFDEFNYFKDLEDWKLSLFPTVRSSGKFIMYSS